jgi:glycosyltransferase involved in cell wall biosynthesis
MHDELPLVSIVTPSLNKGRFIEETILSIKNQTYPRIEHIVIDGGSTDETLDILRKYGDSLVWISEPDKGLYDASNKGLRMAKGEILGWLMADDTYMPQAVETAVKFLIEKPDVAMVYGKCNFIDEDAKFIREFPSAPFNLAALVRGPNIIPSPTVFFRKEVLASVGYFDTKLYMSADYDLFIRTGLRFRIEYIPKLLATYRLYPGTKSTSEYHKFGADLIYIYDKLFSTPELPREVRRVRRQAYGFAYMTMTHYCANVQQMKECRKHLIKACMLRPQYLKERSVLSHLAISLLGSPISVTIVKWVRKLRKLIPRS